MISPTTADVDQTHNGKPDLAHPPEPGRPVPPRPGRHRARKKSRVPVKTIVFALIVGGTVGGMYATLGKEKTNETLLEGYHYVKHHAVGPDRKPSEPGAKLPTRSSPWDGIVTVKQEDRDIEGFRVVDVKAQTEPIRLELNGTTDYDLNTLTKIRPRFDNALIEKVFVSIGQRVKKGDPLMELTSADLAQARTDCQTKYVQWDHDHKLLTSREQLAKDGRITQIVWTDTQNDEKKSRLDYFVASQKLATYGITSDQIKKLVEGLGDDKEKAIAAGANTPDNSRMTVCAQIDGVVVERDMVPGNFYDQKDLLLTISPMDQLWVYGNVFESDQDKVHLGQRWEILLPFSNERFEGKVESIANGVDAETRTLRIRASIPNPGNSLKARMLVRAILQIAPLPGDTVIPRNALSVVNGEYYAFVQLAASGKDSDRFERRKLEIEQENHDEVVVKKGLKAGERVVSNGSLILAQMFEDQSTTDTGMPTP